MSKPVKVTYNGGVDEVVVLFPSGDRRLVKRGESVEILASDAATLSATEWAGIPTTTPAPAPTGTTSEEE